MTKNGEKNISPNEKEKVSVLDYYAVESRNNTRNSYFKETRTNT